MPRSGKVFFKNVPAGRIWQNEIENEFGFQYDKAYLAIDGAQGVSFTLPLAEAPYVSGAMIPFFDGLIPEGWLLNIAVKNWKLDPRDRMGLLLTACQDCIGAVHIIADEENN